MSGTFWRQSHGVRLAAGLGAVLVLTVAGCAHTIGGVAAVGALPTDTSPSTSSSGDPTSPSSTSESTTESTTESSTSTGTSSSSSSTESTTDGAGSPLTEDDLYGLLSDVDGGSTLAFTSDTGTDTDVAAEYQSWDTAWTDNSGSPEECREYYVHSGLVATADQGGSEDVLVPIGTFTSLADAADAQGSIEVNGRVFGDAAAAQEFLTGFREAIAACPTGYELVDTWDVDAVAEVAVPDALPTGVAAVRSNENVQGGYTEEYEITVLNWDNVLVEVEYWNTTDSSITGDDEDAITRVVAERLAQLG